MKTLVRRNRESIVDSLTDAQKLIFAPLAFQALVSMMDLGMIKLLDENPLSEKEIMDSLELDEYTVRTLLQIGILNKIVKKDSDEIYSLTKMGRLFLYDDMTKANYGYIKDVCYLGASELTNSFKDRAPRGLQKFVGDYPTIYPALTLLPEDMKNSWYEFDHLYSDNCFEEVYNIIREKYDRIYDIGGNTGKFERLCLKHDEGIDITMLDLKINIDKIKNDDELKNCKFHPINVLDNNPQYPSINNSAILMSQFLDCFSKEDILKILSDLHKTSDNETTVYILEPFTDNQKFEGAEYSLAHTSLYFTCMANGVSKFYTFDEMRELVEKAGYVINRSITGVGSYDYTLLECVKA